MPRFIFAGPLRALDDDGNPLLGATVNFFLAGTVTPAEVFSDLADTISLGTSLQSNSDGYFPFFSAPTANYRVEMRHPDGSVLWDVDNIEQFSQQSVTDIGSDVIELQSNRVLRTGDTMTGPLNMSTNSLFNLGALVFRGDLATGTRIAWIDNQGLIAQNDGTFAWRLGFDQPTTIPSIARDMIGLAANVHVDGNGNLRVSTSRLANKENPQMLSGCLARILQLSGYTFTWRENGDKIQGLIADYLEAVNPLYVEGDTPSPQALIADLIGAVKELAARIEALEGEGQ